MPVGLWLRDQLAMIWIRLGNASRPCRMREVSSSAPPSRPAGARASGHAPVGLEAWPRPAARVGSAGCHLVPLGAGEENLPDGEHTVFYWGVPPRKKS